MTAGVHQLERERFEMTPTDHKVYESMPEAKALGVPFFFTIVIWPSGPRVEPKEVSCGDMMYRGSCPSRVRYPVSPIPWAARRLSRKLCVLRISLRLSGSLLS